MSPFKAGVLLAALVAGPPLWSLASGGMLGGDDALERWGLVAAGCAVGAEAVGRLAGGYASQARRRRITEIIRELTTAPARTGEVQRQEP